MNDVTKQMNAVSGNNVANIIAEINRLGDYVRNNFPLMHKSNDIIVQCNGVVSSQENMVGDYFDFLLQICALSSCNERMIRSSGVNNNFNCQMSLADRSKVLQSGLNVISELRSTLVYQGSDLSKYSFKDNHKLAMDYFNLTISEGTIAMNISTYNGDISFDDDYLVLARMLIDNLSDSARKYPSVAKDARITDEISAVVFGKYCETLADINDGDISSQNVIRQLLCYALSTLQGIVLDDNAPIKERQSALKNIHILTPSELHKTINNGLFPNTLSKIPEDLTYDSKVFKDAHKPQFSDKHRWLYDSNFGNSASNSPMNGPSI